MIEGRYDVAEAYIASYTTLAPAVLVVAVPSARVCVCQCARARVWVRACVCVRACVYEYMPLEDDEEWKSKPALR